MEEKKEEAGKVGIKTILKGNAAQAIRSAAMSGFKVADFQMNPAAKESPEDYLKSENAMLQSQIAVLNGEAANLKKKAEHDAKTEREKGFAEGKAHGEKDGENKALNVWNAKLADLQKHTENVFESVAQQQKMFFGELRDISTEIAVAVAKRVFCEEQARNPQIIARAMQEAFTFLGQEEKIKVRLNPLDILNAEKTESFWRPIQSSIKSVELVPDEKIEQGGCLLESENGSSIDMRVQTVFGHIEEKVRQLYSQGD